MSKSSFVSDKELQDFSRDFTIDNEYIPLRLLTSLLLSLRHKMITILIPFPSLSTIINVIRQTISTRIFSISLENIEREGLHLGNQARRQRKRGGSGDENTARMKGLYDVTHDFVRRGDALFKFYIRLCKLMCGA